MLVETSETARRPYWYAIRTRSRHEKKVHYELAQRGVLSFLPLHGRWSRWKDRTKKIEEPLFPGYCFAQLIPRHQALTILRVPGVVELVGAGGSPEPVDDHEIEAIQQLISSKLPYDPHPFLREGMEVEVVRGPLVGVRGTLVRKDRATRLVLSITLTQHAAAVEIHPADIVALPEGRVTSSHRTNSSGAPCGRTLDARRPPLYGPKPVHVARW